MVMLVSCEDFTVVPIRIINPTISVVYVTGQTTITFEIVNPNGLPVTICADVKMYPNAERRMVKKYVLFEVISI
jgi:hypothetical protein